MSDALYSASLSFWLLLILKSQPGVGYKSVVYKKKHVTLFFSLLKMKKQLCHMSLFLCLSGKKGLGGGVAI